MTDPVFPEDFLWGASTAAHQVEGDTHNQWSDWELANAKRLAKTASKRLDWLPNWGEVKSQAADADNYVSGRGVEHYHRYKEDLTLLKELNMNAFRFSIEWSRLEPEEGKWNEEAIEHYHQYMAELKRQNIEPIMTLWHWTVPVWFADKGGFAKRSNLKYFERFVQQVAEVYGQDLRYVLTLNEPSVYTAFSYITGEWPPQRKRPLRGLKVYWHLVLAHRRAYRILKQANPNIMVGIAAQLANNQPARKHNMFDNLVARIVAYSWNWWFLNCIRSTQDFIGINYYFTDYYRGFVKANPRMPVNDLGWYMEPAGIRPVLEEMWRRYKKPIIITENGLADAHDMQRQWWLEQTLQVLGEVRQNGVDVRGYLHWSLLDNFEWAYGWWPEFGLIHVDRQTMQRTIRPSARWFARRIVTKS